MNSFLAFTVLVIGQVSISGPTEIFEGQAAHLKAVNVPAGTAVIWDVYPEVKNDEHGNEIITTVIELRDKENVPHLIVTGISGKYSVKLRVIKGEEVSTIRGTILVKSRAPVPPNPPGPNPPGPNPPGPNPPGPQPVIPDGKYGLAKKAYEWANKVKSTQKVDEAQKVAGSFEGAAAAVAAGAIKDINGLLSTTTQTNRESLGASAPMWADWMSELNRELSSLFDSKKLVTLEDHRVAWLEIATGLKAVR